MSNAIMGVRIDSGAHTAPDPHDHMESNPRYNAMYGTDEPEPDTSNLARFSLGAIGLFDGVWVDKEQALKVLEEAAEVYGSWQAWDVAYQRLADYGDSSNMLLVSRESDARGYLIEECADTLQALANLLHGLGVTDLTPYLRAVEAKNIERGHEYLTVDSQ